MCDFSDILLTVDYDRTLTAPDSTVPQRNIEAIRYFMEHGGAFTVNTGRSIPMTKVFRDVIPTNAPLLLYNGSLAYDAKDGTCTAVHEIELDMWQTVNRLQALFPDLTVEVQALDAHYNFVPNPLFDDFSVWQDCAYALAKPGQDLGPFLKFTLYGEFRDTTMSHLYVGSAEELRRMDEAEETLREVFGDTIAVFRAAPRIIDVQASGVSKARAARELQQQLGRKILVCVGDGENDIPMLREADYAYSPADGVASDRFENVCCCANGSVAEVIYEKIPHILNLQLDKKK